MYLTRDWLLTIDRHLTVGFIPYHIGWKVFIWCSLIEREWKNCKRLYWDLNVLETLAPWSRDCLIDRLWAPILRTSCLQMLQKPESLDFGTGYMLGFVLRHRVLSEFEFPRNPRIFASNPAPKKQKLTRSICSTRTRTIEPCLGISLQHAFAQRLDLHRASLGHPDFWLPRLLARDSRFPVTLDE
jgi:hypothetical protein